MHMHMHVHAHAHVHVVRGEHLERDVADATGLSGQVVRAPELEVNALDRLRGKGWS